MGKEILTRLPAANLQFRTEAGRVPWIYAALKNQPEVHLFSGAFPEPFTALDYIVRQNQNQLVLAAVLEVGSDFVSRYQDTVGSKEDLDPFLKRYQNHQFSPDQQQLALYNKDGQIQGIIARISPNQVIIQRGGEAGQIAPPKDGENVINNLSINLDSFNLLAQRYVNAIWKASPETNQKKLQLVLDIPALPEGAAETYFSTFDIISKEFREHPRPVDLNKNIGGYPYVKAATKSLFLDLTQPDVSRKFGTQPFSNKFILVTGSERTGKSLFPKALDKMLRDYYGKDFEHWRLPLTDILSKYGHYAATIIKTVLDHVQENEKRKVPTLVHLDNLDQLLPRFQKPFDVNGNSLFTSDNSGYYQYQTPPSAAEFNYTLQTINPIVNVLREFGHELGSNSHSVIVYGESRLPRVFLPEGVIRMFRRSFSVDNPNSDDLKNILRVQINTSVDFARITGKNPFASDIESHLDQIAKSALGLNGGDIQQALINVASRKKAESDATPTTDSDISEELNRIRMTKGLLDERTQRHIGFSLPHSTR